SVSRGRIWRSSDGEGVGQRLARVQRIEPRIVPSQSLCLCNCGCARKKVEESAAEAHRNSKCLLELSCEARSNALTVHLLQAISFGSCAHWVLDRIRRKWVLRKSFIGRRGRKTRKQRVVVAGDQWVEFENVGNVGRGQSRAFSGWPCVFPSSPAPCKGS